MQVEQSSKQGSSMAEQSLSDEQLSSEQLLSEQQSADLAKVSLETIRHYHKSGLLKAIIKNAQPFFIATEIKSLFYIEPSIAGIAQKNGNGGNSSASYRPQNSKVSENHASPTNTINGSVHDEPRLSEVDVSAASKSSPASDTTNDIVEPENLTKDATDQKEQVANISSLDSSIQTRKSPLKSPGNVNVNDVQAQGLQAQIEILREERDWLRKQLERMESQFEREQMLLLSNSETLRRVVNNQPLQSQTIQLPKRSFWEFLLPWKWETLFSPSKITNSNAISHHQKD